MTVVFGISAMLQSHLNDGQTRLTNLTSQLTTAEQALQAQESVRWTSSSLRLARGYQVTNELVNYQVSQLTNELREDTRSSAV